MIMIDLAAPLQFFGIMLIIISAAASLRCINRRRIERKNYIKALRRRGRKWSR